jgi:hypothetical protein
VKLARRAQLAGSPGVVVACTSRKSKPFSSTSFALKVSWHAVPPRRSRAAMRRAHASVLLAYSAPGESVRLATGEKKIAFVRPHTAPAWPGSATAQRPASGVSKSSRAATLWGVVLRIETPGAARSTCVAPKFEKPASASDELVAATQTLLAGSGSEAGTHGVKAVVSLLVPLLPAAMTYSAVVDWRIASSRTADVPTAPRLTLTTLAPLRAA